MECFMDGIDNWVEALRNLNNSYDSLASFREVAAWVEKAENVFREADEFRQNKYQSANSIKEKLSHAENERKNKSFMQRNFGSRKGEKELSKDYEEIISEINALDKIIGKLRQQIVGLPKNRNEQKEMINKINTQKRELNIQKREINESIRQVNASARNARAGWAGVRGGGIIGTTARISRANITQTKEDALSPLEAKRADLEARLALLEREELRTRGYLVLKTLPRLLILINVNIVAVNSALT